MYPIKGTCNLQVGIPLMNPCAINYDRRGRNREACVFVYLLDKYRICEPIKAPNINSTEKSPNYK